MSTDISLLAYSPTRLTYEELNLMDDLPMFGTARIPKSEVVRSLEAKGRIRIIAVEPFYFVVEKPRFSL